MMAVDPNTANLVVALGCFVLGSAQLSAWATGRLGPWTLCWGLGNLMLGIAATGVHFIGILPDYVTISVANTLGLVGHLLTLQAVRLFVGRAPRWRIFLAAAVILSFPLLLSYDPAGFAPRVSYNTVFRASCDVWIVAELVRLARRERLSTAWTMAALFTVTVPIYAARAILGVMGALGTNQLHPPAGLASGLAVAAASFIVLQASTLMALAAERSNQAIADLARCDGLTRALNRFGLDQLRRSLTGPIALILMDLDHFKALNDRRGHACGDAILCALSDAARPLLAGAGAGQLVRLGGDEFLAVLPGASADTAKGVADDIMEAFNARAGPIAKDPPVPTLSMGLVAGHLGQTDFATLLGMADRALYTAKTEGRNRVAMAPAPHGRVPEAGLAWVDSPLIAGSP